MRNNTKGFTLIELLVVIAIIGILATIVLTSLGSARSKANDAKAQAQLSSMRAQAELFYNDHSNYGTDAAADCSAGSLFVSGTDTLYTLLNGLPAGFTKHCYTSPSGTASAWAVTASNTDASVSWCADSTGASKTYNGTFTAPVAAACQ